MNECLLGLVLKIEVEQVVILVSPNERINKMLHEQ